MTTSNTATPAANSSVVPRTTEEYLELRGDRSRPLHLKDLYACYNVTGDEYKRLIQEASVYVVSRPDILDAVHIRGNTGIWRDARYDIERFITTTSSWNKPHLFGDSNATVPKEFKADALRRTVADVRREIRDNSFLYLSALRDQIEQDAGSTTPNSKLQPLPARSTTDVGVYGTASLPPQERLPIKNLRHVPIALLNGDGETIEEMTAEHICDPVAWAYETLQINWMDFRFDSLLDMAAQVFGIERENICLHYHGRPVTRQGCLEAAVNDFSNGHRTNNTVIEFTVTPRVRPM
jgi:hypothetical protein